MPSNVLDELVVAARVSFRNADNTKWVLRELTPDKVKAEVTKRIADEFPRYKGIAEAVAEAAIAEHAKRWGYTELGLSVTHYSEVLMFIGSPIGMKLVNEVGLRITTVEREAFRLRREERRNKLEGLTGGKVVNFREGSGTRQRRSKAA